MKKKKKVQITLTNATNTWKQILKEKQFQQQWID